VYAAFGIRVPNLGENDKIIEKAQKRKLLTEDRFEIEAAYRKIQGKSMEAGLKKDRRCGGHIWAGVALEGITRCKKHRATFSEASQD